MANDPGTRIVSPDYGTADQALTEAIGRRDAALVARGLENRHLELKLKAATALGEFGDKASVPHLIEALVQNEAPYAGGSESVVLQADLNRALVAALHKVTGVDFGAVDPQSRADLNRALRLSRDWWEKNRP
ncbi:MAG: hypothetical protein KIT36_15695 [Alphaproteobacteria bacterium]|nr:hypothetical protein [Alphaproteobacteria bacterium]